MARTRLRGVRIGGIEIGIEVPADYPWRWPDAPIADFACLAREPEVHVGVRLGAVPQVDLEGERYSVPSGAFEVKRQGEDWLLGLTVDGHRDLIARFDGEFRSGEVVISRESARAPFFPLAAPLAEWILVHRTLLHGGLCLRGIAFPVGGQASVRLGDEATAFASATGWRRMSSSGAASSARARRPMVLVREENERLRVYPTPWSEAFDLRLAEATAVVEVIGHSDSVRAYRERLDPDEAAELLVTHAVVPFSDEVLLDRALCNARRLAGRTLVLRIGGGLRVAAPIDWQSAPLQCAFGPPQSGR